MNEIFLKRKQGNKEEKREKRREEKRKEKKRKEKKRKEHPEGQIDHNFKLCIKLYSVNWLLQSSGWLYIDDHSGSKFLVFYLRLAKLVIDKM